MQRDRQNCDTKDAESPQRYGLTLDLSRHVRVQTFCRSRSDAMFWFPGSSKGPYLMTFFRTVHHLLSSYAFGPSIGVLTVTLNEESPTLDVMVFPVAVTG